MVIKEWLKGAVLKKTKVTNIIKEVKKYFPKVTITTPKKDFKKYTKKQCKIERRT